MTLRNRDFDLIGSGRRFEALEPANLLPSMNVDAATPLRNRCIPADHRILAYWPLVRSNPLQALLYSQGWRHGWACLPVVDERELAQVPSAAPSACHFHWLKSIRTDEAGIQRFSELLDKLKQQRRKIVWTVHNVLPHDQADIEGAIRIRKLILEAVDLIHIMNEETAEMVAPFFSIRHKPIFYSPHPSYLGAYPNTVTREEARFQFGFCPDTTVFLCFGAILRYKGIEDLLSVVEELAQDSPKLDWRLVIAGVADDEELVRRIRGFEGLDGRVLMRAGKVPVEDVEYYLNAADYCILPYRRSLNSGAAMLAMSFGVPLIAPATATFKEPLLRAAGLGYRAGDAGALASALRAAIGADPAVMRANAVAFAEERRPEGTSAAFFHGLTARLAALD